MEVQVVNGGPGAGHRRAGAWSTMPTGCISVDGSRTLERLESRTITIPYPWVEGEPHVVALVTSTGLTFTGDVAVADPVADGRTPAT